VKTAAFLIFVALVVAANWLTATFGMVGGIVTAGTFAAGLTFLARDVLQDVGSNALTVSAITAGAALSALMSPSLALASGVAFLFSELADYAVYTPLRKRTVSGAVLASNAVGAVLDSLLFLFMAGFPLTSWGTQSAVKVAVTLPILAGVVIFRAVFRHRVRA
jgi:uncharacterized PurR-regulated membrane protein YhhQ (DUF165 family)